jgi:hypothetical protein
MARIVVLQILAIRREPCAKDRSDIIILSLRMTRMSTTTRKMVVWMRRMRRTIQIIKRS